MIVQILDDALDPTNTTTAAPVTVKPTVKSPDYKFLIVPLVVIVLVMLLSAIVYCMARRRRLNKIRRNILSLYEFDSNEQEWESRSFNIYDNPNYNTYEHTSTL